MKLSRRELLGTAAAGAATLAYSSTNKRREARNVIFVVADGMALQTLSMWDQYSRIELGRPSYWAGLIEAEDVTNGLQETRSLNSVVTDSSAASSAWGSGTRIWNGAVNTLPDGTKLQPICSIMSEAGVRCGLVTTTRVTHATPAGFASSVPSRAMEDEIAEQYLASGVDVFLGGGSRHFDADQRDDKRDLAGDFARAGFEMVRDRAGMKSAKGQKLLGLFTRSHLSYAVDRDNDAERQRTEPTLAEMSQHAINNLKHSPNGFLLQIEGGRVDHAAHSNDLAGMLYDQQAHEEALKVAIDFARADGETLVIATTDHACGGPSLNGDGPYYGLADDGLAQLSGMKRSYESFLPVIGISQREGVSAEQNAAHMIKQVLGVPFTVEEAAAVLSAINGDSPFEISPFADGAAHTFAELLSNYTKVTWTSGNHTSDHVIVTALGPGSEACAGLTRNTAFFDLMLAAKGLSHENPRMSLDEARRFIDPTNDPSVTALAHD